MRGRIYATFDQFRDQPLKLILVILFFILGIGEYHDGVYDVGDYAVPLLLFLMLNDVYINWKRIRENPASTFKKVVESKPFLERLKSSLKDIWFAGSSKDMDNNEKAVKIIMNNVFFILFLSPVFMELLNFEYILKADIYKIGVVVWSGVFLSVSIMEFRKTLKFAKLVYCNVAFMILIGSLIIL